MSTENKRIVYNNLLNLINESIANEDTDTLLETIQYVARRFNIYLKLRDNDIALIQLIRYDKEARLIILNKYGLEIVIDLYPDPSFKYLEEIRISYVLSTRVG